jgi:hypothetical protein
MRCTFAVLIAFVTMFALPGASVAKRRRSVPGSVEGTDPAAAPAPGRAAPTGERTEADLMFDAINASRGETPNAGRIADVVAEASAEARRKADESRKKARATVARYWKDPWSDDPHRAIPVRPRVSNATTTTTMSALTSARREAARARAETASARADAAVARADAARAKAEVARAEASAAHADALAAKQEAEVARLGCADPTAASPPRSAGITRATPARDEMALARGAEPPRVRVRAPARRARAALKIASSRDAHRAPGPAQPEPVAQAPQPPPPPAEEPPAPKPAPSWRSTDTRGIVVVPLNTAPTAPPAAP